MYSATSSNWAKKSIFLSTVLILNLGASSITFNDASVITQRTMPANSQIILSYNNAVKEATKSIVYISTTQDISEEMQQMHPFFEQFFEMYYKVPKHIFIVDEYPLTASGKVQKFKLREMAVELMEQN